MLRRTVTHLLLPAITCPAENVEELNLCEPVPAMFASPVVQVRAAVSAIVKLSVTLQKNWELYLVAVLIGIGGGFLTPVTTAMSAVIGKSLKSIGTVMSMLNMGQSLGMFVGPLVAGLIMDHANLNTAFLLSGITFTVLLLAGMVLSRNYRMIELSSRF